MEEEMMKMKAEIERKMDEEIKKMRDEIMKMKEERQRMMEMMTLAVDSGQIICVKYTNNQSADNNGYKDLKTGRQNHLVASNLGHLGHAKKDDIVMICSDDHIDFGIILEKVEPSDIWQAEGGKKWKYNFRYHPIAEDLEFSTIKQMVNFLAKELEVTDKNMFNTRLCGYGERFRPVLKALFINLEKQKMLI